MTQQDEQRTGYRVARQQRPRCPLHGCLMRVESSKGPVGYAYCPVDGCCQAAKVIREKVADD